MANCINPSLRFRHLFFFVLVFVASHAIGQESEQIEIVQGEELIYIKKDGEEAQRLVGNVIFRHQDALMYCDSAYQFLDRNSIEAYGSIRINQGDTINLYGDFLDYNGDNKIATVRGKEVKLISTDFILTTDLLIFDRQYNTARYTTGGEIVSKNDSNHLVSTRGFYDVNAKIFTFKDSVVLTNPDFVMRSDTLKYFTATEIVNFLGPTTITGDSNLIYCENGWYDTQKDQSQYFQNSYIISDGKKLEGDTLYYDRILGLGKADGNIQITDTLQDITINGLHGRIFEHNDSAVVTDSCLLTQLMEGDSLFMHADTFKVYEAANEEKFLMAYYGVRIFKSDLQGVCDSIAYSLSDSTISLFDDPILWSGEDQITADSIDIKTKQKKIHRIYIYPNAYMISKIDSLRFNQVKGKKMEAFFKESKLKRIEVRGNGQITHYALDDLNKFIGVSVAESSDIDISVGENAVQSISLLNDAKSITYPMGELDPVTELRYKDFRWLIDKKPKSKEEIFGE